MGTQRGSIVLLEELFASEDPGFIRELERIQVHPTRPDEHIERRPQPPTKLSSFAERWYRDARPWARRELLRYIATDCDRVGHRPLVKRVFKLAEAAGDDELMAAFLVSFDRLIAHKIRTRKWWDWSSNEQRIQQVLVCDPASSEPGKPRFSGATRAYLRRRVIRYFRALGRADAARFRHATLLALAGYTDESLGRGEQITDASGLLALLCRGSHPGAELPQATPLEPARHSTVGRVAKGSKLAELRPAPMHAELWNEHASELLEALPRFASLFVRRLVVSFLHEAHPAALRGVTVREARAFLTSGKPDLQALGADLLAHAKDLSALSIDVWLELLRIDHPDAIALLVAKVRDVVSPARLDLRQCVQLSYAQLAPVAELAIEWAKGKPIRSAADLELALPALRTRIESARSAALAWLAPLVILHGEAHHLRDLLDSPHSDVRARAVEILDKTAQFRDDPSLWAALAESPYPDMRDALVAHLEARMDALPKESLLRLWASTLLSVRRGSRAKRQALEQLSQRIVRSPDDAETSLPLMAIALRSVREPERRAAIAALVRAASHSTVLRQRIARDLPDLALPDEIEATG